MTDQPLTLPPTGYEYGEARRRYVEQYGSTLVMNTYLKVALLCLSLVIVGLIFSLIGEGVAFRNVWIELHPFDSCGADVLEDLINNLPTAQHLRWLFYADGLCGGKMRPLLGLSVPQWSLLGFSVQSFVLLWIGLRHRRAGRLALHGARFV